MRRTPWTRRPYSRSCRWSSPGWRSRSGRSATALAQGRSVDSALDAMARQPDLAERISRTLFIGLAMIESLAIYCLVVALILLFANPFTSK